MELTKLSTFEFMNLLASREPAPGGGAAAALTGALGAALAVMVCCLTEGKEKFAAHQALVSDAKDRALDLTAAYLDLMDRDAAAFQAVSAAYRLPKDTQAEKTARSAAIQQGLRGCTAPPMEMMELAVEALELTASLVGKSNPGAVSDLGVSALSLRAAIQGAWLNVLININTMKDQALAADFRSRGEALLAKALPLADEIYDTVAAAV